MEVHFIEGGIILYVISTEIGGGSLQNTLGLVVIQRTLLCRKFLPLV